MNCPGTGTTPIRGTVQPNNTNSAQPYGTGNCPMCKRPRPLAVNKLIAGHKTLN